MLLTRPLRITVYLLSTAFLLLGAAFIGLPEPAAAFYGLAADDRAALLYVRAIGLRDLALAGYLLGLTLAGQRRALSIVLAGTILIPAGDILLLLASGAGQAIHYSLHGISLLCFASLAYWSARGGRSPRPPGSNPVV